MLLAGDMVGNGEGGAAFGAATGEYLAAVFGGHSFAESVLVDATAIRGLKCSFHCCMLLYLLSLTWACASPATFCVAARHHSECKITTFKTHRQIFRRKTAKKSPGGDLGRVSVISQGVMSMMGYAAESAVEISYEVFEDAY